MHKHEGEAGRREGEGATVKASALRIYMGPAPETPSSYRPPTSLRTTHFHGVDAGFWTIGWPRTLVLGTTPIQQDYLLKRTADCSALRCSTGHELLRWQHGIMMRPNQVHGDTCRAIRSHFRTSTTSLNFSFVLRDWQRRS